ncbi:aminotransferase class IV [Mesorhizobium sp. M0898]|uniref:aminotransferase class IV n=1 Tax=Mesorhizobium sp. M0898 TaxID=2957020 RepID=UPI003337E668
MLFTQKKHVIDTPLVKRGQNVITLEDMRWRRCDIKTVQLVYPCMAKMEARSRGADDAWLVRDGFVTEGSTNNAHIITPAGKIVTRDLSTDILHGITRQTVLQCAQDLQLTVEERPFTIEEAENAAEAYSTCASGLVSPVVSINERLIGSGRPGPITASLRQIYIEKCRASAF